MEPLTLNKDPRHPFEALAAPEPWRAWLLRLPAFPLPDERLDYYGASIRLFSEQLARDCQLNEALALQIWKLPSKGGDLLQQRMDEWPFDLGFGIWPNRPAPTGWNGDSIQDAAAAVYRGDEPSLPMHRILLFKMAAREAYRAALEQMSGFGALVQIFSRESIDSVRKQGREQFLPRVTDPRFRGGRVYLPVLDGESLHAASSAAELGGWLCGADIYVRESAEDRGLLVISRLTGETLPQALDTLAGAIA